MTDAPEYFDDDADAPRDAERMLRGNTTATLQFGEFTENLKYVLDHRSEPIAPIVPAMISSFDAILFIPDQTDISLEIMVTPEEIDIESEDVDRWRIYHGEPKHNLFARFYIEAIKYGEHVIDGESFAHEHPLLAAEPGVCKHMNADHQEDLRVLCRHFAHVDVERPMMVGLDPYGIDVRAKFGIVRVEFEAEVATREAAKSTLIDMTKRARAAVSEEEGKDEEAS